MTHVIWSKNNWPTNIYVETQRLFVQHSLVKQHLAVDNLVHNTDCKEISLTNAIWSRDIWTTKSLGIKHIFYSDPLTRVIWSKNNWPTDILGNTYGIKREHLTNCIWLKNIWPTDIFKKSFYLCLLTGA